MYSPTSDTVQINGTWVSYKDAVQRVNTQEDCYQLLETFIEASREEHVPDDLKQAIKLLVDKMF